MNEKSILAIISNIIKNGFQLVGGDVNHFVFKRNEEEIIIDFNNEASMTYWLNDTMDNFINKDFKLFVNLMNEIDGIKTEK